MKVRFAVSVGSGTPDPDVLGSAVIAAEKLGFDTVWLSDVPSLGSTDPLLGVALAAGLTQQLHLGINFIPFGRTPYLVAHELAQLDRLAGGRLLITLVPGLELPMERQALGTAGRHRGRMMDGVIPQLRAWWAGSSVEVDGLAVTLPVRPVQEPLELWLGGSGPEAIARAGRLADGWLGSLVTPERAGQIRRGIQDAAASAGRVIDPEHFGLSLAYARHADDLERAARIRPLRLGRQAGSAGGAAGASGSPAGAASSGDADPARLVPVGADALRRCVGDLIDQGLSKFVVRSVLPPADNAWADELAWIADTLLYLQT